MTAYLAVKHAAAVTVICAFFASGSAQSISELQLNDINAPVCGENQFTCRNGECIQSELLCDGRVDCSDQSDETQVECTKPELTCPDYTFRCNYGACVNGDATCNGVRDCFDGSDETLSKCPGVSSTDPERGCGPEDYTCRDGQCINATSLCDGALDCVDGSDETFVNCGSFQCSQLVFRCNYGACIDGDLTCNNVSNCADNSDEDPMLCGRPGIEPTVPPVIPTPSPPTPRPTPTPTPSRPISGSCVVPPQPNNGHWKLDKTLCGISNGGDVDCDISQGIELEPGSFLNYRCAPGYKIRGTSQVDCRRGRKWSQIPVCIEIKCSPLNSPSMSANCWARGGEWISCDSATPPGTTAEVSCRSGYRKDTNSITTQRESVHCNPSGKWEPDPINCIPVCGKQNTHQKPFVVNGQVAKLGDFPWHATLYREMKTAQGSKKEFQCGATIIQANLVLTAAHCIYDEASSTTQDPSKLFIMTGNIFRDYDSQSHNPATVRKRGVKNVYRHCQYYGLTGNYASDIALLELTEPFKLSEILLPACLDVTDENAQILETGAFGRVPGFGRTATGDSSGILQTLRLPYVSYNQCKNSNNAGENVVFIGNDKFCAGYNNGSAVCEGDSGGGLVFQKGDLWYVMGIVSVGLGADTTTGERTCDRFSYSLYTKVHKYMGWIQKVMFELQRYKSYASCNSNVTIRGNL